MTARRRLTRAIIDALAVLANRPYRSTWSHEDPDAGALSCKHERTSYGATADAAAIKAELSALAYLSRGMSYPAWSWSGHPRHHLAQFHFRDAGAPAPRWLYSLARLIHRRRFNA